VSGWAPQAKTGGDLAPVEEERAVVARLQHGDREAFATLYGWYGDLLYRQAILPRLPVPELAEDCLRETFRTALEKIDTFRLENRSIFFWLRRIAVNKAIDVHRRHRRDLRLVHRVKDDPDARPGGSPDRPDRSLEIDEVRRQVDQSLSNLNARYARALRMRLIEDRTREECAQALGVTIGNFDVILHRAATAFRKVYPP
jgi:RNA polymerase sigma-70 factor (ECF subfamily)